MTAFLKNKCIVKRVNCTHIEGVEEDEQWDLNHADLYSNATAHFKAVAKSNVQVEKVILVERLNRHRYQVTEKHWV